MKIAFLHEDSERETFMYKPEGFEVDGNEHMVYMLKKSLYDLRRTRRQWYKKFDSFMMSQCHKRIEAKHCTYICQFSCGNFIILLYFVDDRLIIRQNVNLISKLKEELSKSFDMKNLSSMR